MDDVGVRIATLEYRVGRRRRAVYSFNPALPEVGGWARPESAACAESIAISDAAAAFELSDACALWLHLAAPAADQALIATCEDNALVATADPSRIHHISGIAATSSDEPRHRELPVRDVLDAMLDNLDWRRGRYANRPASAHELWECCAADGPPGPVSARTVGPYTGWRLEQGATVRVSPLGHNNFRTDAAVRRIQATIDGLDGTVESWCDAHDALVGVPQAGPSWLVAPGADGFDGPDRRLLADLFLDLILWHAGRTAGPPSRPVRRDPLGFDAPLNGLRRPGTWSRVTSAGASELFIGMSEDGFELGVPSPAGDPATEYRITVPHTEIDSMCRRLGAPAQAHPGAVVSLFVDDILAKGPLGWLVSQGVELWTETPSRTGRGPDTRRAPARVAPPAPDAVTGSTGAALPGTRFDRMLSFRAASGGHDTGLGLPGKSEFPAEWSTDTTLARIDATMDSPDRRTQIGHTVFDERTFDGVLVCCVWRRPMEGGSRMLTAFPVCGDGVALNPYPADYPADLVTSVAQALPDLLADGDREAVRLVAMAAAVGEPYEAVQSGLWVALRDGIALPEKYMMAIGTMVDNNFFAAEDDDEIVAVFNVLARRDHPEATSWGQL
ncbi:hypothetical protein [Rhodococcus kronopolitis]|uniref:Uncharacterized protein n=1 Tax=Rhodococcus kronopolitis TaxID=1460226 RepID=A0ABV9FUN6_9NOCA